MRGGFVRLISMAPSKAMSCRSTGCLVLPVQFRAPFSATWTATRLVRVVIDPGYPVPTKHPSNKPPRFAMAWCRWASRFVRRSVRCRVRIRVRMRRWCSRAQGALRGGFVRFISMARPRRVSSQSSGDINTEIPLDISDMRRKNPRLFSKLRPPPHHLADLFDDRLGTSPL